MIYKNNKLITGINRNVIDELQKKTKRAIGKVYLGTQLVWITIANAIRSCFGSGTWLQDRNWINDDNWTNS